MAVPRNRHSNARRDKRRSHMAKVKKNFVKCSNCAASILPHKICDSCGFYNKKQINAS